MNPSRLIRSLTSAATLLAISTHLAADGLTGPNTARFGAIVAVTLDTPSDGDWLVYPEEISWRVFDGGQTLAFSATVEGAVVVTYVVVDWPEKRFVRPYYHTVIVGEIPHDPDPEPEPEPPPQTPLEKLLRSWLAPMPAAAKARAPMVGKVFAEIGPLIGTEGYTGTQLDKKMQDANEVAVGNFASDWRKNFAQPLNTYLTNLDVTGELTTERHRAIYIEIGRVLESMR